MLESLLRRREARARIAAQRARMGFVNGLEWLLRDPKHVVGRTPWEPVLAEDKLVVRRYRSPDPGWTPRYRTPVLLVPPLMVKPFIFDLHRGRSLVLHLLEAGFPVYLVDFGEPDSADAYVTLDHYVIDWLPAACAAVRADAASDELSLLGYCMGGLFALSHTAANADAAVRNIVSIAAPVDTHEMGLFAWFAQHGGQQLELISRKLGNVPGSVSSTAFKLLTPLKNFTRYADLFMNMWDREYVNGFDAMNQWTGQFIDYPQGAFQQFLREFMQHNKLIEGGMEFRGRPADLRTLRCSLLVFAGETDKVVPAPAARAALDAVGGEDTSFRLVSGGHMGVFAGSRAPAEVWAPTATWLGERSAPA